MAALYCSRSLASICCDLQPRRLRSRFRAKNLNLENMRTVACEKLVGFPDRKSEGNHGIADDSGFFVHEQYLPPMLNSLEESNPPDDDFSASPHCGVAMAVMRVWGRGCDSITGAWNVSIATISRLAVIVSAPDDHFSASPHCRGTGALIRRASDAGCGPIIHAAASWIFNR